MARDTQDALNEFIDQEGLYHTEGRRGIENLARIVNTLGYQDPQRYGQFRGASLGDIFTFLEDNPGAIEALVEWIGQQQSTDWAEALNAQLPEEEGEDDQK